MLQYDKNVLRHGAKNVGLRRASIKRYEAAIKGVLICPAFTAAISVGGDGGSQKAFNGPTSLAGGVKA